MIKDNFDLTKMLLVPPGEGIYTVSTGNSSKKELWQKYFKTDDQKIVLQRWKKAVSLLWNKKNTLVFGCPSDNGGAILRGANWGPIFARIAFSEILRDFPEHDLGDILVNPHLLYDELLNEKAIEKLKIALYHKNVDLPVSALSQIAYLTQQIWNKNYARKVFFLAGDHSCSYPIAKSWCKSRKNKNFAILHFDAHTDLLESRLGIDYCFGTWANQILTYLPKANHLFQVGIRTSGKNQKYWESTLGVKQIWSEEVLQNNIEITSKKIAAHFKKIKVKDLYISLDVDVFDPSYFSCTGTAESKGLAPHHFAAILSHLSENFNIQVIDLVEFAPFVRQPNIAFSQLEPDTSLLTLKTLAPLIWKVLN